MKKGGELIFVYNADSAVFAQISDFVQKNLSPSTYKCNLCGLTYGALGMKSEWKDFLKSLRIKADFLHRDEFLKDYEQVGSVDFPAVFVKRGLKVDILISSVEINKQKNLDGLKNLVSSKTASL